MLNNMILACLLFNSNEKQSSEVNVNSIPLVYKEDKQGSKLSMRQENLANL